MCGSLCLYCSFHIRVSVRPIIELSTSVATNRGQKPMAVSLTCVVKLFATKVLIILHTHCLCPVHNHPHVLDNPGSAEAACPMLQVSLCLVVLHPWWLSEVVLSLSLHVWRSGAATHADIRVIIVIVTHVVIMAFVASLLSGTRSCHSHQHQGLAAGDDSLSCEDDLRPHRHKAIGVPFDNPHGCRTMALPQPCRDPGRHRQLRHLPPGRPRNITVHGANLRLEDDIVDLGCARHDPTYPMATLRNWHSTPNPDTGDHQTLHHPTIVLWNIPSTTAYLAFEHHTTPQYTTKNMTLFRVTAKGWPGTSSCSW